MTSKVEKMREELLEALYAHYTQNHKISADFIRRALKHGAPGLNKMPTLELMAEHAEWFPDN